jgi:hypothetical protein
MKFDDIAEQVGYSERGAAYRATMNAIRRETSEDAQEVRTAELARIDELMFTYWPKAKEGDVAAMDRVIRLDRRAKYLGLDFSDGIAERQVQLQEAQGALLADVIKAILEDLELTKEQRQSAPGVVRRHLTALSA